MIKTTPSTTARQTALQILYTIEVQKAYTDVVLRQELGDSTLDRRDRAFVTECVYGVVRWQGRLDWLLAQACRYPLETLTPWIRNILRLSVYQCLWMTRVPQHAAVHAAVELARRFGHRGVASLVNGVLRAVLRHHTAYQLPDATTCPAAYLAVAFSHPQWLIERWLQRYGQQRTQALCEANNCSPGVTLRTNTMRITAAALAERLSVEGLQQVKMSGLVPDGLIVHGTSRLDSLPSYHEGLFQVQDEGAMLVAPLCRPQPGQQWFDACAAPGGKATHLAQLTGDHGQILAGDIQVGRLRLLRENVRRLGYTSIMPVVADASRPIGKKFDGILVDAPCSGFGVVRRHPDIKWRKVAADLTVLQRLQLTLIHEQQKQLAVNGVLVYSVCSNEPEETYQVVESFLARHPHMRLEAVDSELPQPLPPPECPGTLNLTPEQWHTEGVFVARFRCLDSSQ